MEWKGSICFFVGKFCNIVAKLIKNILLFFLPENLSIRISSAAL
jgi:hypothetical protein